MRSPRLARWRPAAGAGDAGDRAAHGAGLDVAALIVIFRVGTPPHPDRRALYR
ncbi:MAG: hypothetical protein MZV49_02035 [Rhodopseudomonas palustris]|nr:hypothetical protein [Rhodopseudomonas palustris]